MDSPFQRRRRLF